MIKWRSAGAAAQRREFITKKLTALEDVLTRPGKHAARMARALYRAAHEAGGRLIVKDPDEL